MTQRRPGAWRWAQPAATLFLGLVVGGGCAGESRSDGTSATDTTTPAESPAVTPAPNAGGVGATTPGEITPTMIALGDSIFHGQVAGAICQTCHGPDAKGTPLAPNLTDRQWLNSDGSYQQIVSTITTGVPTPKQYPAAMPPMGGMQLTPAQVRAVAAYVYSLSGAAP